MLKQTPLHSAHLKLKAHMVPFAGWDMPLHYGSAIEEHNQVRNDVGMFDVSHMLAIDIHHVHAKDFLRKMLANDLQKLIPGKALYSCMLNPQGGIIDDLIVYQLQENHYRLVVNGATRDSDAKWLIENAKAFNVEPILREDLSLIAFQGARAFEKAQTFFKESRYQTLHQLKAFQCSIIGDAVFAATGYTGEPGYEIMLPAQQASQLWDSLLLFGIKPIGLAARDSLRLEAGLNLYGQDMDELHTPYESNVGWTVDLSDPEREFIGRTALLNQKKEGVKHRLVGVVLMDNGVLRKDMLILLYNNSKKCGEGKLTSGGYSPTLKKGIGLARIPVGDFDSAQVEIRGKLLPLQVVKPPFVKAGKVNFS